MTRCIIALAALGVLAQPVGAGEELTWRRRALPSRSAQGYIAVVSLTRSADGAGTAAMVCEAEGVELHIGNGRWSVEREGAEVQGGRHGRRASLALYAKRTEAALLVGLDGRWVYSGPVGDPGEKPAVRIGTGPGLEVASFRLVAREPVRFADDFPDPEPKPGRWAPVRGRWALSSLSSPEHSANPAELAALFDRLEDEGSRGRTRRLDVGVGLLLAGGRYPVVARVAGDSPAQRAGIERGDRILSVDGAEVESGAEAASLIQGTEGTSVAVSFRRGAGEVRRVELRREMIVWGVNRRQVLLEPYRPDDLALITAGYDFWTDYRFSCAVRTQGVGAVGLVFAYQGPGDYHVFRWLGAAKVRQGPGRWVLERVRGGERTVLAEREGGFWPRDFYALSVAVQGDALGEIAATCAVDGTPVLEARDDAIVPGRIGLWAEAPGAVCFDDVLVAGHGADVTDDTAGSRTARQRFDQHMKAWGNPAYAWQLDAMSSLWWHRSDFPGDVTLSSPLGASGAFRLVVSASRGRADSGYAFELDRTEKTTRLKRDGTVLAEKPLKGDLPQRATLRRRRSTIQVDLDGQEWLQSTDPEPLRGSAVVVAGVPLAGFRPSEDVDVESPNVVEYYFNGAPAEWHVAHGHWEVMNRWICDPRWSFFGGRSEDVLAVWNQRRLEGDCFVEVYVGPMMFDRSGNYANLRDLGVTLCGDGKNLASGYTVIVGANANEMTALFRNGRLVASRRDSSARIPAHGFPGNRTIFPSRHRGWVPITVAKQGSTVCVYLFDQLVLTHYDPEPLDGGYVAFWSVDNGLLLAKARLAASRISSPHLRPFLRTHEPFADAVLTNDCGHGGAEIIARGAAYEIRNPVGGGAFAVALRPRVFSAFDRPSLSFDIKLSPEAKVDLYLTCHGQLYRVVIAGPQGEAAAAKTLGVIEGVEADGQWHTVHVDLVAALREEYPEDSLLMVWQPMLANYATKGYLLAGFGGNGAGARYWVRDIAVGQAEELPRLSHQTASP